MNIIGDVDPHLAQSVKSDDSNLHINTNVELISLIQYQIKSLFSPNSKEKERNKKKIKC
jgi:hypothetical protein